MFQNLRPQPQDPILMLMDAFRSDPRPDKIDLGVGVYRNEEGITPVMRAVKAAERRLLTEQSTKGYTGLNGDPAFLEAMTGLVLDNVVSSDRVAASATVGGTGAVRNGLDLMRRIQPDARLHIPSPSWPNHAAIGAEIRMPVSQYRYFDPVAGGLDFDGMLADLSAIPRGDIVLLHGCCHNPSGADPSPAQWTQIIDLLHDTGVMVLVDLAYMGLGDGIAEDAAATRQLAAALPELIIAVSCSKNFGLYRDRAGAVIVVTEGKTQRDLVSGTLATLNRLAYSFPADHGAKVVESILNDPEMRQDWLEELTQMRVRINSLRRDLSLTLRDVTGSDRFAFFNAQKGMFSLLPATPGQVQQLREDYAVYMVGDGRMNIAGLTDRQIPALAHAIKAVCG
ncbi:aromatic amino acid transaminase [Pseudooceanicola sp. C21-150M6]|uniref:amino acid aminotransferase n=1 Tax=Pseudooceanicola sp. C21-150M6 TaxID=3434355 RepID=UPI003D7FEC10